MKARFLIMFLCAASVQAQNTFKDTVAEAKQGNLKAQVAIGDAYNFGRGTRINYRKAEEWYKKAVDQGSGYAAYEIGLEYELNQLPPTRGLLQIPYPDVTYNMQMARLYMLRSTTLGYGPAMAWMGWYFEEGYRMGRSVGDTTSTTDIQNPKPQSPPSGGGFASGLADAIARKKGDDETKINTSTSVVDAPDYPQAIEWYRKGADADDVDCELALGRFYEQGLGAKKDPALAMKWYGEAASHDDARAKTHLELLFEQYGMPSAQCNDGTFSLSHRDSGTCSAHGGVRVWIDQGGDTQPMDQNSNSQPTKQLD